MMAASFLTVRRPGYYSVAVHVKPGARTSAFAAPVNTSDEAVEVRVAAPPVEGQANTALVDLMQSTLDAYVREMQLVKASEAKDTAKKLLAGYFEGTAYQRLSDERAKVQHKAAEEEEEDISGGRKGKKASGKGKKKADNGNRNNTAIKLEETEEPMPERVSVALSRGSTSRSKLLEIAFPGSDIELVCLLQMASKDAG